MNDQINVYLNVLEYMSMCFHVLVWCLVVDLVNTVPLCVISSRFALMCVVYNVRVCSRYVVRWMHGLVSGHCGV